MNIKKIVSNIRNKIDKETEEFKRTIIEKEIAAFKEIVTSQLREEFERRPKTKVARKSKPTTKKLMSGFTPAKKFIPVVEQCLKEHGGSLSKKELSEEILKMKILVGNDLGIHADGQRRFYKTLDRTKREMIDLGILSTHEGIWQLNSVKSHE